MVEGTGLENRRTGEPGIESSNLSLSVLMTRKGPADIWRALLTRHAARRSGRRLIVDRNPRAGLDVYCDYLVCRDA